MNFSFFVARKYFWSGKKKKFINVISIISMFLVMVGTAALIIVLSVFNGLEDLLRSLHNHFDPEIKITAVEGKSFRVNDEFLKGIEDLEGVSIVTEVIEDNAYLKYRDSEMVVTVKGVSENFIDHMRMDQNIVDGSLQFRNDDISYAVIGRGIQHMLSISLENDFYALQLFYPRKLSPGKIDPRKDLKRLNIMPGGVFAIEKQFDEKYVFVPLDFAMELLDYEDKRTSLEIKIDESADMEDVQQSLKSHLGPDFEVLNNEEQHATILRAVKVEKLIVFIIFAAILMIASVNIFFALTMLAIDKKKDIAVLYSMGATSTRIRRIFIYEGLIISISGTAIGLFLGWMVCYIQLHFGLVSMGLENAVVANYPVKLLLSDFGFTAACMFIITLLISYRPAIIATRTSLTKML